MATKLEKLLQCNYEPMIEFCKPEPDYKPLELRELWADETVPQLVNRSERVFRIQNVQMFGAHMHVS